MKILTIDSLENIETTAKAFINIMGEKKIFAFNGKMGAGKTTFIKAICEKMGVKDAINSPTFSIVNEYETENSEIIFHFDCYRINNINEAYEIGIEEYLNSGNLCFIEWAENIAPLLPFNYTNVNIEEITNGKRTIQIQ
jgi:tRNA threonylcarbamoyladenosine biosynthesis protein TsaE